MATASSLRTASEAVSRSTSRAPFAIRASIQCRRPFSQTCIRRADDDTTSSPPPPPPTSSASAEQAPPRARPTWSAEAPGSPKAPPMQMNSMNSLNGLLDTVLGQAQNKPGRRNQLDLDRLDRDMNGLATKHDLIPYHLNITVHRHNTHIVVSKPNRDVILSLSSGNIGFKGSGRGAYDAAYQLGAFVMNRLTQLGYTKKIHKMEVIFRGTGPGRDALGKILLGQEGRMFRDRIIRVIDATKIQFGGVRGDNPKRR